MTSFRADPDCCQRATHRYLPDAETPFGASVQSRLDALGVLRCPLASSDGSHTRYEIRVSEPGKVTLDQAVPSDESCSICFSQLRFEARIQLHSADGSLAFDQRTTLRELDPGEGYVFQVAKGDVAVRGVLRRDEPGLRTFRFAAGESHGDPLAESDGACVTGG